MLQRVEIYLITSSNTNVVSFRRHHHVQLCLVRPSLTLIPVVESQGQRVVITHVNFFPVPEEPKEKRGYLLIMSTAGLNCVITV